MCVNSICFDGLLFLVFIFENWCGLSFNGGYGGFEYYYFDGCIGKNFFIYDFCGEYKDNVLKNVEEFYGNIYVC